MTVAPLDTDSLRLVIGFESSVVLWDRTKGKRQDYSENMMVTASRVKVNGVQAPLSNMPQVMTTTWRTCTTLNRAF